MMLVEEYAVFEQQFDVLYVVLRMLNVALKFPSKLNLAHLVCLVPACQHIKPSLQTWCLC